MTQITSVQILVDHPVPPAWVAWLVRDLRSAGWEVTLCRSAPAERLSWLANSLIRRLRVLERDHIQPASDAQLEVADASVASRDWDPSAGSDASVLIVDLRSSAESVQVRQPIGPRVWRPRFGPTSQVNRAGLFEVATRQSVLDVRIVETSREGRSVVIRRALTRVNPDSVTLTRNAALWKASHLLARGLRGSLDESASDPYASRSDLQDSEGIVRLTTAALARKSIRWIGWQLRRPVKRILDESWHIVIFTHGPNLAVRGLVVPAPRGHFFADPHLHRRAGDTFMFFEDFDHSVGRGAIGLCRLPPDGRPTGPYETVISDPGCHLSFPSIIEDETGLFMVVDSSDSDEVRIYESTDFPHKWHLKGTVGEGLGLVDPTVFRHDGRYWLMSARQQHGLPAEDELWLYSAQDLFGPWEEHGANPVVADVRCARPAGTVFASGPELIRPAQDCSMGYGTGLRFRRIDALDLGRYQESPRTGGPSPAVDRTEKVHTYSSVSGLTALDQRIARYRVAWVTRFGIPARAPEF